MTDQNWTVNIIEEAQKDYNRLDGSVKKVLIAGLRKVSKNPLPKSEGGYGKPLGNHNETQLCNFLKIKYKGYGIRVVYTLVKDKNMMNIVVVSFRDDSYCYKLANSIKDSYGDSLFKDVFKKFDF